MTKTTWLGVGLAAIGLAVSSPVMAQGAPIFSADATFRSNPSKCVEKEVQVFVRGAANNARGKIKASVIEVDYCKDQTLLDAQVETILAKGALSSNGNNVTLDTTIQMLDQVTHNPVSMTCRIQWTGGEAIVATTRLDIPDAPGQIKRLNRASRKTLVIAKADGSWSSGGKNYIDGPAEDAAIMMAR